MWLMLCCWEFVVGVVFDNNVVVTIVVMCDMMVGVDVCLCLSGCCWCVILFVVVVLVVDIVVDELCCVFVSMFVMLLM